MAKIEFDKILRDFLDNSRALYNCLKFYSSKEGLTLLNDARQFVMERNVPIIFFIGHSYNYFASLIPYYYLNSRLHRSGNPDLHTIECIRYEIDDFLNFFNVRKCAHRALFCFISQSGESIQVKQSIQKLKAAGIEDEYIWGITNNLDSYLSKGSYISFPVMAGEESMFGIKTYSVLVLVLYLLSRAISNENPLPPHVEEEIRNVIFEVRFYGNDWDYHTKSIIDFLGKDYRFLYFIAKGTALSTAYQAAQSCKAYARTFGEGIPIGIFMRGPFQIVDDSFRCILITNDNIGLDDTIKAIDLITNKMGRGKIVLINNNRELSSMGRANRNVWVFEHANTNPYLSPIFEINMLQFLLLQRAKQLGIVE